MGVDSAREQFPSHTLSTYQFSQPTDDSEASKQARPSRFSAPCSEKGQGQITKDLTDTREREEFQNSSDTDED